MKTLETKQVYSKVCVCGHTNWNHHASLVWPEETRKYLESSTVFQECEFDFNLCSCQMFIDQDDPHKDDKIAEYVKVWD